MSTDECDREPAPVTKDEGFRLEVIDLESRTWRRLKKHLAARRDALRAQNDNPKLDAVQTALLRGQLRAIVNLLALDDRPAPATVADDSQGE